MPKWLNYYIMNAIGIPCLEDCLWNIWIIIILWKITCKKMNKNAPSEKKSIHCAIKKLRPVRASTMAAWKIPTLLCFDKIHWIDEIGGNVGHNK